MLRILWLICLHTANTIAIPVKPVDQLVKDFGYPLEVHPIHTADHYILTYHRIPYSQTYDQNTKRQPILLVHGIFMSSYLFLSKKGELAYALADAGFDVWLGNYRGNYYSMKNELFDPVKDKATFWNYTLTEFGSQDLPAAIDYILDKTGYQQLGYIGESMGTTMFWILGATRPDYMTKISIMVGITPIARLANMSLLKNPVQYRIIRSYLVALKKIKKFDIEYYNEMWRSIINGKCKKHKTMSISCRIFFMFYKYIIKDIDKDEFRELTSTPVSSVPVNVLLHYMQISKKRRFQQFDYGTAGNLQRYQSKTPPEYDMKRITCPVYLVYSKADRVANIKDTQWLIKQLPKKPTRLLDHLDHLTHMDFALHKDIPQLLCHPLSEFMNNYFLTKAKTTD